MSKESFIPNLAGQHQSYLAKRLHDLQGTFEHKLKSIEIEAITIYYSNLPLLQKNNTSKISLRGQQLYRTGDSQKHILACAVCHGPQGKGNPQAGFPAVKGQNFSYIKRQLQTFKSQQRQHDLNGIMRKICVGMSEEDIKALADYISHNL